MSRSNDIAGLTTSILDGVTAAEVGLGNVDNTADSAKPVSTAQQSAIDGLAHQSVPHIIPDVLYPAVAGKLLDGTTNHGTGTYGGSAVSTNYGTTQSDGRKYYYTDIKGSKPIKDPRIGGHFGSQRHKFKSLQLLEQETATHGKDVYSIDGREWCRVVGSANTAMTNNDHGHYLNLDATGDFIEITGYFNNFNTIVFTHSTRADDVSVKINGGTSIDNDIIAGKTSVLSPLISRYVDSASVINHGDTNVTSDLGTTPKINTLKLELTNISSEQFLAFGIELIAQDTTSTANRSKIQIPSQNVVSYGKKFTVSGTPHYDPFNGFTSGSSVSSYVDTATSLGLDKWLHSSNYYRPYNGMRVIKWVDENGTIKTSVTCMPPNAKSIGDSSSLTNGTAKANASVANNTFYPTFEAHTTDVNEDNLHEVAKTFYWREFGNGSANEGSTTSGSYQDASMLDGYDDIAYVMDDGLTSLSADDVNNTGGAGGMHLQGDGDDYYITFIGTGIAIKDLGGTHGGTDSYKWYIDGVEVKNFTSGYVYPNSFLTVAQNLPYGSHILQVERVTANTYGQRFEEVSFYQPKKPPIPEDACVLADYMLMADFVKQTDAENGQISKGVRSVSGSRDVFCNDTGSRAFYNDDTDSVVYGASFWMGMASFYSHASTDTSSAQLPFFGTDALVRLQGSNLAHVVDFGGSTGVAKTALDNSANEQGDMFSLDNSATLGVNTVKTTVYRGGYTFQGYDVRTPIHTSHHYQTFETPFLHELVGGDRNMEQTNLVVSPDGKTWDQITRDTSYLGNVVISATRDGGHVTSSGVYIWDDHRGSSNNKNYFNKHFAIAYDRFICLEEGFYEINVQVRGSTTNQYLSGFIRVNGTNENQIYTTSQSGEKGVLHGSLTVFLKRGDYFDLYRNNGNLEGANPAESHLIVKRV